MKVTQGYLFEENEYRPVMRTDGGGNGKEYDAFVAKFKRRKTTDDCYTPSAVMEVVERMVRSLPGVGDRPFVRPFWPGGDYKRFNYPEGCIVVDNPPFSIYSKIVRWYLGMGIDFFLFAPHLTCFVKGTEAQYVIADAKIIYENGAVVKTSFVTSLLRGDTKIWLNGKLAREIEDACNKKEVKPVKKYIHSYNVLTTALAGKYIGSRTDIRIAKGECLETVGTDMMLRKGSKLFGTGFYVSDRVKERLLLERDRLERDRLERDRLERDRLERLMLNDRELKIIEELNNYEQ